MKKSLFIFLSFCLLHISAFAQTAKDKTSSYNTAEKQAQYMGLWDMNATFGSLRSEAHAHPNGAQSPADETMLRQQYGFMHFQESLLSNYIWAKERDKKIKFGLQETMDLGWIQGTSTNSTPGISNSTHSGKAKSFLFNYEAGAAIVYKISTIMDAGFTFNFFTLPGTFASSSSRNVKLRFRYTNFLAELSLLGSTTIELKYLKNINRDKSDFDPYIGIGFRSYNKSGSQEQISNSYFQVNFGALIF